LSSFFRQPLRLRILRGILLALVLALLAYYTPTPYQLEAPGRAIPASSIISIADAKARPVNGQYLMATVLAEKATVLLCVYGLIDPDARLTRTATGQEGEQAQSPAEDARQMELSQYLSSRVALQQLGYPMQGKYKGLRILQVGADSPNRQMLRRGDLLTRLEDYQPPSLEDLRRVRVGKSPDSQLQGLVERGTQTMPVQLRLKKLSGELRLGVVLQPEFEKAALPVRIDFQTLNTSGASAGLCFALEIYDQLAPEDLARGRVIAATGTLDGEGRVGGIQGLPFKLVAAERANAEIFLVPRENWPEVQNSATSMKIIPVSSFQEALDALR
jgi:PDZ domain-containing protein